MERLNERLNSGWVGVGTRALGLMVTVLGFVKLVELLY